MKTTKRVLAIALTVMMLLGGLAFGAQAVEVVTPPLNVGVGFAWESSWACFAEVNGVQFPSIWHENRDYFRFTPDERITWESSNENVVRLYPIEEHDIPGILHAANILAVGEGEATLSVTVPSGPYAETYKIQVVVQGIYPGVTLVELNVGGTYLLEGYKGIIGPENIYRDFISRNPAVASIERQGDTGIVRGESEGLAVVYRHIASEGLNYIFGTSPLSNDIRVVRVSEAPPRQTPVHRLRVGQDNGFEWAWFPYLYGRDDFNAEEGRVTENMFLAPEVTVTLTNSRPDILHVTQMDARMVNGRHAPIFTMFAIAEGEALLTMTISGGSDYDGTYELLIRVEGVINFVGRETFEVAVGQTRTFIYVDSWGNDEPLPSTIALSGLRSSDNSIATVGATTFPGPHFINVSANVQGVSEGIAVLYLIAEHRNHRGYVSVVGEREDRILYVNGPSGVPLDVVRVTPAPPSQTAPSHYGDVTVSYHYSPQFPAPAPQLIVGVLSNTQMQVPNNLTIAAFQIGFEGIPSSAFPLGDTIFTVRLPIPATFNGDPSQLSIIHQSQGRPIQRPPVTVIYESGVAKYLEFSTAYFSQFIIVAPQGQTTPPQVTIPQAPTPPQDQPSDTPCNAPWWANLPAFLQWILRWIFFGWVWMC